MYVRVFLATKFFPFFLNLFNRILEKGELPIESDLSNEIR